MVQRWVAALVAIHAVLLLVFTKHGVSGWQDGAMVAGVYALLDHGTLALTDQHFGSGDIIRHNDRVYAAKLPLLQVIGALVFACPAQLGMDLANDHPRAYYLLSLLVTGGCSLATVLLLGQVAIRRNATPWKIVLGLGGLSLGSVFLAFSTVFYYHVPAGLLLLGAFLLLRSPRSWRAAAAGMLVGLCTGLDFPTGTIACLVLPVLASAHGKRILFAYMAGCAIGLVPYAALNLWQLGSLIPYHLQGDLFVYPGSRLADESGEMGAFQRAWPLWAYPLWGTVGSQGLFSMSPVTALWIVVLIHAARRPSRGLSSHLLPLHVVARTALALTVVVFVFYNLFAGGATAWSYGQRMLVPLLPVWCLLFLEHNWPTPSRAAWRWGTLLLVGSAFFALPGVFMPFTGAAAVPPPQAFNPLIGPLALWPLAPEYWARDLARGERIAAEARLAQGDAARALPHAERAVQLYPTLAGARVLLARCLWESDSRDYERIRAELYAAQALGEAIPHEWLNRVEWLCRHSRPTKGRDEGGVP